MVRCSYLCSASNFVFNYCKQRKQGSKVTQHMCFSASAASVYLHREWLLQPCLRYSVCIIALHLVLTTHTHIRARIHTRTGHHLSEEALRKQQLRSRKKDIFLKKNNNKKARQRRTRRATSPAFQTLWRWGILIFLPYRSWVEFAFAAGSRPFLLLFQYVRALFEWGHPLPTWPGASSTSADLIESTTWVKFKQAETASPWQPHYSTLRTHSRMVCDSAPDKCRKGMKSNKRLYFWEDYCTSVCAWEGGNPTLVLFCVNDGGCLLG